MFCRNILHNLIYMIVLQECSSIILQECSISNILLIFRICPIIFGWQCGWRINNFQIEKFSLRVFLSICLIFCQFQSAVAYKSIAYKKKSMYLNQHFLKFFVLLTYLSLFTGLLVYFASVFVYLSSNNDHANRFDSKQSLSFMFVDWMSCHIVLFRINELM